MEWKSIDELFEFQKKSKIKARDGQETGKYILYSSSMTIDKFLDDFQFKNEALILGTGGNANIHYSRGEFSTTTDCYVLESKSQDILPRYVYKYLKGNIYILEEGFRGAGLKHINQAYLKQLKVPVYTKKVQNLIIEVLDEAQKLINNRKRQIKLLDDLIESIFYDMFGDPIKNDKGWESNILGEYIDVLTDYHANGSYKALRENVELLNQKSYALMIRTTDLENNNYDNDVKYIDKSAYEFLNKSKVFAGDLIINKIGSAGEVYLMPDLNRKVSLGMNQFLMRTDNKLKHIYLYILFNSKNGNTLIKSKAQGAVTKTINKKSINNIELPIPPIQLQNQFAEKVELIERQKSLLQQSLKLLEDNYNNLMQKAFKGELF